MIKSNYTCIFFLVIVILFRVAARATAHCQRHLCINAATIPVIFVLSSDVRWRWPLSGGAIQWAKNHVIVSACSRSKSSGARPASDNLILFYIILFYVSILLYSMYLFYCFFSGKISILWTTWEPLPVLRLTIMWKGWWNSGRDFLTTMWVFFPSMQCVPNLEHFKLLGPHGTWELEFGISAGDGAL